MLVVRIAYDIGAIMKNEIPEYHGVEIYSQQDHHGFVKENFKRLAELIRSKLDCGELPEDARVLDVGCATGALISYLASEFPGFAFEGIDASNELITIAREKVTGILFETRSVFSLPDCRKHSFDIVLFIGVIGIFDEDDARDAVNRLIECTKQNGYLYVFHQFNEFDVDVMVKHRRTDLEVGWEAGWNIYSYRTVASWLHERVSEYRFIDFEMPFSLDKNENPVRTWTIDMNDGSHRLTNGLKLLVDLKFLEVKIQRT